MKTLAERIAEHEKSLVSLKDQLVSASNELEAAPDQEPLIAQVEELTGKIDTAEKSLAALKKAENALASRAVQNAPAIIQPVHMQKHEPKNVGDIIFKRATASMLAFVERKSVEQVIAERYGDLPHMKAVHELITKTAVNPATTTTAGWAAELVRTDTRGFIEALTDVSVAAALAGQSQQLDFGGFNSIKIPRRNPLPAVPTEPAWVGEGGVIPLTSFSFGATELFRYKLAAISTFTRELAERSTPAIEELIRQALRDAYAEVLDQALLGAGAAVAGVRPAGLLNGLASLTPTAGGGEDSVRGDVLTLLTALASVRAGRKPVLLLNNLDVLAASSFTTPLSATAFPELGQGRLLGIPVISSANVPQHRAIIVDAAYFATAFDAPDFDTSDVATVTEANADGVAPTQAQTGAGALGTAGQVGPNLGIKVAQQAALGAASANYTARSLWQTYSLGVRMVAPTSWGTTLAGVVAYIDATEWTD